MSVWMLRDVIWIRFFTKPVCWQNSVVIFENSYLPHMTLVFADIWSVFRPLSQESKTIAFASIGYLQHIEFWMDKGQHWQNASFDFEGCDFHTLCIFIFLDLDLQKVMDVSFLMPLESLHFDSRTHALHKTSTEGQICQLPPIYSFLHLSSKGAFKT
jgi:hypothetical protein